MITPTPTCGQFMEEEADAAAVVVNLHIGNFCLDALTKKSARAVKVIINQGGGGGGGGYLWF
jgi:hypothetical protein